MRAIITDIRAGKAAALAEDGTVHLVDAKNRAVGQEIRIPAKRRRRWKKPLTWAACVAVLCGMATTGVYAAYEPYASVSVVGGTDSVEYTVNRFDQVLGTRVSGREQPPDGKIPRFVHIDKAVEHTVRQEAKEGERCGFLLQVERVWRCRCGKCGRRVHCGQPDGLRHAHLLVWQRKQVRFGQCRHGRRAERSYRCGF